MHRMDVLYTDWNRQKRHDLRLGLAICIPIYGYVIYKLLGG